MARNRHPEETVNLILDVAFRLFMEKGYEHTSVQDIINNLGGLSKGAIYHHFKSKEDILVAVTDRMTAESNQMLAVIRDRSDISGKEKLKTIFRESISRPVQNDIFTVAPDFHNNPKLLFSLLHDIIDNAAPNYIFANYQAGYFRRFYQNGLSRAIGRTDFACSKCLDESYDLTVLRKNLIISLWYSDRCCKALVWIL